jgi:hypothetical protein
MNEKKKSSMATLPSVGIVKSVQDYLETCGMPREAFVVAWDGGDLSGVVARVEGYFGQFVGSQVVVRDAVQNMALDNFSRVRGRNTTASAERAVAERC